MSSNIKSTSRFALFFLLICHSNSQLSTKIFVGVAFSLTKAVMEMNGVAVVNQSSPIANRRSGSDPSTANYYTSTLADAPLTKQPVDFTSIASFLHLKAAPSPPLRGEGIQTPHCGAPFGSGGKAGSKTVNQSVSSFAIVFTLNEAAPPCVQSHFTELARRVSFKTISNCFTLR